MRALTVAPPWMRLLQVVVVIQCVAGARELDEVAVQQAVHFNTGGLSRETFPKGFMFGASASAYQVEGMAHQDGRGPSIWDAFVQEPDGTGKVNWKGVAYYNRLIDYLIEKRQDFADYADFCFKTFGDRVKNWMTFNEPRIIAAFGYDDGTHPPGRCSKVYGNCSDGDSATEPYIVISCGCSSKEKQKGRIGIVVDFVWYEPLTRSKADNYAALRATDFHVGWFLHPIIFGAYPKTMQNIVGQGSLSSLRKKSRKCIWDVQRSLGHVQSVDIHERALRKPNFDGMDDAGNITLANALLDTRRVKYYKTYMRQLKRAIDHGANVVGYFAWSLLDNFEWTLGYTSRFGIVYVDFHTLKRYPKMSALWFKELLARKKH
ncbi:hypothetical protein L6164_005393 [Bauhinia variegata]|uniref:Uncharacterized protein n=1 Tax=Bauhinia variegata TaxID=167791 RepID=A0ACB9PQ66_BAUVA|nr:hypothetical protein L6164_005393 [Bauhinia variegata]